MDYDLYPQIIEKYKSNFYLFFLDDSIDQLHFEFSGANAALPIVFAYKIVYFQI